jgi:quinoprotein dehydrogenase-associated probable ABC transporter substrate-binding protein
MLLLWPFWGAAQDWEMRVCADPNNLPYSNEQEEGFENRIAEIIAEELRAELSYVWFPQRPQQVREVFREGGCDMVMGVTDGSSQFLTTVPYYRSSYVFVYREDGPFEISSLDDPVLRDLRIGVEVPGGGLGNVTPPAQALGNRGLSGNLVGFFVFGDYSRPSPLSPIVEAVAEGAVDAAVVWGPIAGYFAKEQEVPLTLVPVTPQIDPPFLPMVFAISIGLRRGDEDLRDLLHRAMARRWDEIQAVLEDYGVPLEPLQAPTVTAP